MRVRAGRDHSRFKSWIKVVSVMILLLASSAAFAGDGESGSASSAAEYRDACIRLQETLLDLFRTQSPNGAYRFNESEAVLYEYPLVATFSLEIHNALGDLSFTSQAIASASRYLTFLLTNEDIDEDCLVERYASAGENVQRGRFEDAGYNALLALDCMSLSRLCVAVKKPVDALFWHEEARLIASRVIGAAYDPDAGFFFPYDNTARERTMYVHSLSFLPALFDQQMGDNIVRAALQRCLLSSEYFYPEVPRAILLWEDRGPDDPAPIDGDRLLKTAALLCVLHHNGFGALDERYRARAARMIDSLQTRDIPLSGGPCVRMLGQLLETGRYRTMFPLYNSLDILRELVLEKRPLDEPEIIRLIESTGALNRILSGPTGAQAADTARAPDAETLEAHIRAVYVAVSRIREQLKDITIISPWKESAYFGAEFPQAVGRLLDDAVGALHRAENMLFDAENRATGLRVACELRDERLVPGENPAFTVLVTADSGPVRVRSIIADLALRRIALFESMNAATIAPGDSTLSFAFDAPAPVPAQTGIYPLHLAISIEREDGSTCRYNFVKGVYLEKPLSFSIDFPRGRILDTYDLPIRIAVKKNAPGGISVGASFFSPSGLIMKEGGGAAIFMDAPRDSAYLSLHVVPPQPCRPGSFPFVIKVYSENVELGMVSGSFFKHYQWLFAGPFARASSGDAERYEPEKRINLYDTFKSGGRTFSWRDLPKNAYAPTGEILLDDLMPNGGVGFLYTVIQSAVPQDCSVFLSSNDPATLFLNGTPAVRIQGGESASPQRSTLSLREGLNEILIKTTSTSPPKLYFKLGDDEYLASDEFDNNLWALIEGYRDFRTRREDTVADPGEARKLVTLSYADGDAHSVSVIGSFNGWSPEHSTMRRISKNGWEITLNLEPGKYTYRFLINNRRHTLDPACAYQESDGYGGKNSVLFVE